MKVIRNTRAISRVSLVLLLLVAMIIGALGSYMFVMGYYVSIGFRVPEMTSITITSVAFPPQVTTRFNITIVNPSYSPSSATITQIVVVTEDNALHGAYIIYPEYGPYTIDPGELKEYMCFWDWSDYTNETVTVAVFIAEGSGATLQAKTPL